MQSHEPGNSPQRQYFLSILVFSFIVIAAIFVAAVGRPSALWKLSRSADFTDEFGVPMMLVPAGEFLMGSYADDSLVVCQKYRNDCQKSWFTDEEPPHNVYLDAFYIDRYEVTNVLYHVCVDAGECSEPYDTSHYNNARYADHPVVFVDWNQADTFCQWRGARLPTEAEWEKAARGEDGRMYPWGEGIDCNKANYYDSTRSKRCVGDTTRVGRYENSASPYGVYDMAGNVWEWVADWYDAGYYAALGENARNPQGPISGSSHVLRGGSGNEFALRSVYRSVESGIWYGSVGFRCVLSSR